MDQVEPGLEAAVGLSDYEVAPDPIYIDPVASARALAALDAVNAPRRRRLAVVADAAEEPHRDVRVDKRRGQVTLAAPGPPRKDREVGVVHRPQRVGREHAQILAQIGARSVG